ncbi:MAG: ATP-binding protein [Parcubacteria group bacterium]|nr:ATP-binding protein [Parcubacteria group bacterium]
MKLPFLRKRKPKEEDALAAATTVAEKLEREVEALYKEGVTNVRDIIAPASMKVDSSHLQLGSYFIRSFFTYAYPRYLTTNWLAPIINLDFEMDIAMFIYPIDSGRILKILRNKAGQIQSSIAIAEARGDVRDPLLETALNDVEDLRDKLQQGTERFFKFALYFTLYTKDQAKIEKLTDQLSSILSGRLVYVKASTLQMEQGFNSSMPLGNDELGVSTNMNTSPLSTTFPFVSSELTSNTGILYGLNRHNNSLIIFDRFSLENANTVVFAKSGAGKSYAVKLEILRSMMFGMEILVIDPESEYKYLAEAVGGSFLSISLNSPHRINPFDLVAPATDEIVADVLRSNVIMLIGLVNLMLGKLTPEEDALVDRAIYETYARYDITPDSKSLEGLTIPTMTDLKDTLHNIEGGEELSERLSKYTEGTFAGILNQPTNIQINNQLVVFSIRDLEPALRPIAMYVILNYIWNLIRRELKKRILVVDEAWWMIQYEDSARFLFSIAKRARKYFLGLTTITQDVQDFLDSKYGKAIVTNSSLQLLLKQSPAAIDAVAETFFLTEGERYLLLESDVGEGIFFAGAKHAAIKIIASYTEDQIITTNPEEILRRQKAEQGEEPPPEEESPEGES